MGRLPWVILTEGSSRTRGRQREESTSENQTEQRKLERRREGD